MKAHRSSSGPSLGQQLSPEERAYWSDAMGLKAAAQGATVGRERQPLHLALLISPLYLLLPVQLVSWVYGQENVLQVSSLQ